MVISVKHKFQSAKSDSADNSLIRPSNWNDTHDFNINGLSLIGKPTASVGAASEITLGFGLEFFSTTLRVKSDAFPSLAQVTTEATAAANAAAANRIRKIGTGVALPTVDEGVIWHEDYKSLMVWTSFTDNGASYTGYASVQLGMPMIDGISYVRQGWLKRNGASVPKATYPALWNFALHMGLVVALGSWSAGQYKFADNGDGTFKLPDTRGYFDRQWSDGVSIDSGRLFGSRQDDEFRSHKHKYGQANTAGAGSVSIGAGNVSNQYDTAAAGGAETRPYNTALLGVIKF